MKLRFSRLDCDINISPDYATTLEIRNRQVFARVVQSILSGKGKYAEEPYLLISEEGKALRTQDAILVVNTLPDLPLNDRTLINKLYRKMVEQVESNQDCFMRLNELASQIEMELSTAADNLWGDYHLSLDWSLDAYLKAYKYLPAALGGTSLLDNCIGLIDLCVDVAPDIALVFVNGKSFFTKNELVELEDHAFSSGFQLVLLESWTDNEVYPREQKVVVDQQLIVFD